MTAREVVATFGPPATAPFASGGPGPGAFTTPRRHEDRPTAPTRHALSDDAPVTRLATRLRSLPPNAGPLTPLLNDSEVTDVLVNGPGEVWVDRGLGLRRTSVSFRSRDELRRLAQSLAATCGRRLDDASPYVDVRLPDGARLHAVLPPIAVDGPYLSLRVLRQRPYALGELVASGAVPAPVAGLLSAIVSARLALLVSGGAGAGKTTMLATLLGLVPTAERIVIVEDSAELRPAHPHVVALEARTSNVEGAGSVTLRDLVRQGLRMRPDRLVVGECRGSEVVDLLMALNTGHEGGGGTLHANTPADVPARLEALGLLGGVPRDALHAQVLAALKVVLHMRRGAPGRALDEICLLASDGSRLVGAHSVWRRDRGLGRAAPELARLLSQRGVALPPLLRSTGNG